MTKPYLGAFYCPTTRKITSNYFTSSDGKKKCRCSTCRTLQQESGMKNKFVLYVCNKCNQLYDSGKGDHNKHCTLRNMEVPRKGDPLLFSKEPEIMEAVNTFERQCKYTPSNIEQQFEYLCRIYSNRDDVLAKLCMCYAEMLYFIDTLGFANNRTFGSSYLEKAINHISHCSEDINQRQLLVQFYILRSNVYRRQDAIDRAKKDLGHAIQYIPTTLLSENDLADICHNKGRTEPTTVNSTKQSFASAATMFANIQKFPEALLSLCYLIDYLITKGQQYDFYLTKAQSMVEKVPNQHHYLKAYYGILLRIHNPKYSGYSIDKIPINFSRRVLMQDIGEIQRRLAQQRARDFFLTTEEVEQISSEDIPNSAP